VLIVISLAAVIEGARLTQKNQQLLRHIAEYESHVEVMRLQADGAIKMEMVSSSILLPGDIIQVSAAMGTSSDRHIPY